MKIEFERSGGFAGMNLKTTVETENLSPEAARELQGMVKTANFFALPRAIASPRPGADRFHYTIAVKEGGRQHTVETGEASAPVSLQPLLQRLMAIARSTPQS